MMPDFEGALSYTDIMASARLADYAVRLEELGYRELWVPDLMGRETFVTAGFILAQTKRLRVASGIASVYGRDALSTAQAARTLSELHGDRFSLGLGVTHRDLAEMRGHEWLPAFEKMRRYLQDVAASEVRSPQPSKPTPIYIAANGPRMLALAARATDGANTFIMPSEHTRRAREILGPDKTLNVVLPCFLCDSAEQGRGAARNGLSIYMQHEVYRQQWSHFGLGAGEQAGGGSDRFVDALVAWGDAAAIRKRAREHLDAGATRILIFDFNPRPDSALLPAVAPGVASVAGRAG
jgi:probable F420-dependent oxidoreductase